MAGALHSAPWYVELDSQPVSISHPEKSYLIGRMQHEIARSEGIVSPAAIQEYHRALAFYAALPEADDADQVAGTARPAASVEELHRWLDNMVIDHRFTADEVRLATGLSRQEAEQEVQKRAAARDARRREDSGRVRLLPYPGGRHPRRGFLDGALDPQRETQRVWQNPPVPCIHADPMFPDCPPGETVTVSGYLRFYEGTDLRSVMPCARSTVYTGPDTVRKSWRN